MSHEEDEPNTYSIYRSMIDKKYQNEGYGRRALEMVLDKLKRQDDCRPTTIYSVLSNKAAKLFYASLSFTDVGLDEDGEMNAEIHPARDVG